MKILLIFTLYLISGQVGCSDVIGYPGDVQNPGSQRGRLSLLRYAEGFLVRYTNLSLQDAGLYQCGETGGWSHTVNLKVNSDPCCLGPETVAGYLGENVTISCSYPEQFKRNYKFLFKQEDKGFTEVIRSPESPETQKGRFSISDDRRSAVLTVRISDVREDDGGVYFIGAGIGTRSINYNSFFTEIQLQVSGPTTTMKPSTASTMSYRSTSRTASYSSPTTTMKPSTASTMSYRSTSRTASYSSPTTTMKPLTASTTTSPRRTSTTTSYRSPTRAPPTTASNRSPTTAPTTTSNRGTSTGKSAVADEEHFSVFLFITVCVCAALLLIGGSALIFYKWRCRKIQGSTSSPNMKEDNNKISHSACDYEEIRDIRPHSDTRATPLYSTLQLPPAPSNPPNTVYVTAQLPSNPPVQDTYSMVQLPKLTTEALTYATMSFQKNPYSPIDATVTFNQEESSTEHAPVSHHPRLELTTEY
ncbi:mucin-5AC-like [Pygocentrus nattereri]|uniref:mucin-5AC-like n=1 Tax=Pygocentrus nattereri TaxID=42514 RepID=UPI000814A737|nr:mucin-5AC-like [Pygocentrus nattereri]